MNAYLAMADLKELSQEQVKDHIAEEYAGTDIYQYPSDAQKQNLRVELDQYDVLIAYEHVGDFGCDSSSWFLLKRKADGVLFESHGSHCSCYGFEGQWDLEETTPDYLKSDHFSLCTGGYDDFGREHKDAVKQFINNYL